MTTPTRSLPVIYARVPVETYALAQSLAASGKTSVSALIVRLLEAQRATRAQADVPHEPGYVVAAVPPVKRGRGRPRKAIAIDREDGHARAAEAACSGDDQ
jgi:hypothetical protein